MIVGTGVCEALATELSLVWLEAVSLLVASVVSVASVTVALALLARLEDLGQEHPLEEAEAEAGQEGGHQTVQGGASIRTQAQQRGQGSPKTSSPCVTFLTEFSELL